MSYNTTFISVQNCAISDGNSSLVNPFSWEFKEGQTWLITGPNGGGKAHFVQAIKNNNATFGKAHFVPIGDGAIYSNIFAESIALVSLEVAAALIEEERMNDESDYVEGGVDIGRTARQFICEVLPKDFDKSLESCSEVQLCGIEAVLDRGLKYLSTGEIRRVLLCRALLSKSRLLILSDPFAGLDANSRAILRNFFSSLATSSCKETSVLLSMERFTELPDGITHVLEFSENKATFCGKVQDYNNAHLLLLEKNAALSEQQKHEVYHTFKELHTERQLVTEQSSPKNNDQVKELVSMRNVTVGWNGKTVLDNLNWQIFSGQHWLVRGPNGSGKTTLLELITGDNMQVFCNDVSIFGRRRGTGETVWEIKEKMGIVSYRMHLEYRMVGNTDLEAVLLSGFHDSVGLYQQRSQVEQAAAKKWLSFGGFGGKENQPFNSLSYGEQRAILILRAVVKCPPLLILDEPCHGLDEKHRTRILHLLDSIAATGSTTLLHVTHDPTEVLSCEKHIMELRPGENPMYKIITNE